MELKKHYETNVRKIFFPIFFMVLFNMTLGVVDQVMMGSYDGFEFGVAAIGMGGAYMFSLGVIIPVLSGGASILMNQYHGKSDELKANRISTSNFIITGLISIILLVFLLFTSDLILGFFKTPTEIYSEAKIYMEITQWRFLTAGIVFACNAYILMKGKVASFMYASIIAHSINIALNFLLIYGNLGFPELGVKGSAIATLVSTLAADLFFIFYAFKVTKMRLVHTKIKHILSWGKKMAIKGVPVAVVGIVYNFSHGFITRYVGELGVHTVEARQFANMIIMFVFAFSLAMGKATSLIVGYYIGDKEYKKAKNLIRRGTIQSMIVSMILAFIVWAFMDKFMLIFTTNKDIITVAKSIALVNIFLEPGRAVNIVSGHALNATGDTKFSLYRAPIPMVLFNVVGSYLIVKYTSAGVVGIYIMLSADEWARGIWNVLRIKSDKWIKASINDSSVTKIDTNDEHVLA